MANFTIHPLKDPPDSEEKREETVYGNEKSPNVLKRMPARKREAIANNEVRGYGHLRNDAEAMIAQDPSYYGYSRHQPWSERKKEIVKHYEKYPEQFEGFAKGGKVMNNKSWRK